MWQPHNLANSVVKLVPLTTNDFEALFAVASDPLIWEQHPASNRYQREIFQDFFDSAIESKGAFLIVNPETDAVIGSTRFYNYCEEESKIIIGYTFYAREYWGGTHNPACKKLMMEYAFRFVDTVTFEIAAVNIRSQRAIQKLGATKVSESFLPHSGVDFLYYTFAITKTEFEARQ